MKMFPASPAWWFGILYISVSLVTNGSSQSQAGPVKATQGYDVILPCHSNLNPIPKNPTVVWTRSDLTSGKVHLYRDGKDSMADQLPLYIGRTSLFKDELMNGNFSLKLSPVTLNDAGDYKCYSPPQGPEEHIRLEVESLEDSLKKPKNENDKANKELDKLKKLLEEKDSEIGSSRSVETFKYEDVILPCYLKPITDNLIVEWTRSDLTGKVHLYWDGKDSEADQLPLYRGRTSLFKDELKNGNFSLKLLRVTPSDNGDYKCSLPLNGPNKTIRLEVDELTAADKMKIEHEKKIKELEKKIKEQDKKDKEIGDLKKEIVATYSVLAVLAVIVAVIAVCMVCKRLKKRGARTNNTL